MSEEVAFVAGLFAGEGFVGNHSAGNRFALQIAVGMCDHEAITRSAQVLQDALGLPEFRIKERPPRGPNHKVLWSWATTGYKAAAVCMLLYPYLEHTEKGAQMCRCFEKDGRFQIDGEIQLERMAIHRPMSDETKQKIREAKLRYHREVQ